MPLYRCAIPAGALTGEQKAAIADDITTVHCEVTGAPATFVHVFYFDAAPGTEGYEVQGSIRAGRTEQQHADIHRRIRDAFVAVAGASPDGVRIATTELPASWVMEGGEIMPEPGEEEAWLARHAAD
jgi:phenylpyruvate tautomerase PptA (4-oxalocrotonate tautomerase family)